MGVVEMDAELVSQLRHSRSQSAFIRALGPTVARVARCAPIGLLLPAIADAHVALLTPYILPIPLPVYIFACVATLIITFASVGYMVRASAPAVLVSGTHSVAGSPLGQLIVRWVVQAVRAAAVFLLALTVIAGYVGIKHPLGNINMLLFWTIFMIGLAYLTVFIGNVFAIINPWRTIVSVAEACGLSFSKARISYPSGLAYYPALLFYIAIVWIELLVLPLPSTLSTALIVYTLVTLAGSWLFGTQAWFEHAEFFNVFFRLIGLLAPVEYVRAENARSWQIHLRRPILGLVECRATHISLVVFVLFMLSATTYDAIHQTQLWQNLYWVSALSLTKPLWGTDLAKAQSMLMGGYLIYLRASLVLSPMLYLGIYSLAIWVMKAVTRTKIPLSTLMQEFAFSIIPIAVVYNITHNLTEILDRWRAFPALLTDPFGFGWNIFGVSTMPVVQQSIEMGPIWHTQVALMLVGHMISVYVAHLTALRVFRSRHESVISQIPLLTLMVVYTVVGLWILTLPIKAFAD